jgi:hypothetical protein
MKRKPVTSLFILAFILVNAFAFFDSSEKNSDQEFPIRAGMGFSNDIVSAPSAQDDLMQDEKLIQLSTETLESIVTCPYQESTQLHTEPCRASGSH